MNITKQSTNLQPFPWLPNTILKLPPDEDNQQFDKLAPRDPTILAEEKHRT